MIEHVKYIFLIKNKSSMNTVMSDMKTHIISSNSSLAFRKLIHVSKHSYDILGAGMLWKPKDLHKIC
jgi:hypothetical protein